MAEAPERSLSLNEVAKIFGVTRAIVVGGFATVRFARWRFMGGAPPTARLSASYAAMR